MKKISIFTPCYNEENNVQEIYDQVTEVMRTLPQYEYEYIFSDNKSTDRTREILRKIAEKDKRVKLIFNMRNFGPARSGAYGFYQTEGAASICLACDLQDPPQLIPEFISKWEEGYKVVWGQKKKSDENKIKYFFRTLYYKIIKCFSDHKQYDHITGFGLYDSEVVDLLRLDENPNPNARHAITEYGYTVGLVQYVQPLRENGKSSYTFWSYLDMAITSLITTSRRPLRIVTVLGILSSIISFCVATFYLIKKCLYWDTFDMGMAPLLIGVFVIGSIQIMFMGILGEYLNEVLNRVVKRPLVIEEERINF